MSHERLSSINRRSNRKERWDKYSRDRNHERIKAVLSFFTKMYKSWNTKWEGESIFPLYFEELLKSLYSNCTPRFLLLQVSWWGKSLFFFISLQLSLFFLMCLISSLSFDWVYLTLFSSLSAWGMCISRTPPQLFSPHIFQLPCN